MSRPLCQIQPENVTTVRFFGTVMLVACAAAVVTGKAYCRGLILREQEPINFWTTVILMSLIGAASIVGSFVC